MDHGFIRLWRKTLHSGLLRNHNAFIFWAWCLLKANHKRDFKTFVGFQEITLKPGQLIFGRKMAVAETGLSEREVRTCLEFFKKAENLTIKTTNKFSIISIVNWGSYQYIENENDQQNDQQATSKTEKNVQQTTSKRPTEHTENKGNNAQIESSLFDNAEKTTSKTTKNVHIQEHNNNNNNNTPQPPRGDEMENLSGYLKANIPDHLQNHREKITEFFQYRQKKSKAKRYSTIKGLQGLFRDLTNCRSAGYDIEICLDIAMERDWQTPSVDYFKKEMFATPSIPAIQTLSDEEQIREFLS